MSTTHSNTDLKSLAVIKVPSTSKAPYYCTETEWRDFSQYTSQADFPSSMVTVCLRDATEQIKKDAFHMVRYELVTKDSTGRYFTSKRWWGNRYGAADEGKTEIIHGEVTKYDIQVWEADVTSSIAAALILQGSRINRLMYKIPYGGITEIDALNGFFKLSSDYPTSSSRQIYATYWVSGKPIDEIGYELKRAMYEMVTILALRKKRDKRMKQATTQQTMGKKTITRDEKEFRILIAEHMKEYRNWINWFKPFIGRRAKIGRMETFNSRRFMNRY